MDHAKKQLWKNFFEWEEAYLSYILSYLYNLESILAKFKHIWMVVNDFDSKLWAGTFIYVDFWMTMVVSHNKLEIRFKNTSFNFDVEKVGFIIFLIRFQRCPTAEIIITFDASSSRSNGCLLNHQFKTINKPWLIIAIFPFFWFEKIFNKKNLHEWFHFIFTWNLFKLSMKIFSKFVVYFF